MATGNLFLGTARKKIGDVVMYRRNGQQQSRVRVRTIANPKTDGQALQRNYMAPVTKFYAPLAGVLERSWEGLDKSRSYSAFIKANVDLARQQGWYVPKGAGFTPLPYKVSKGIMNPLSYTDSNVLLEGTPADIKIATVSAILVSMGYQYGDQVTFIGFIQDEVTLDIRPVWARAILSQSDQTNIFANISQQVTFTAGENKIGFDAPNGILVGVALIMSRWDGSKWLRSTQYVACMDNYIADYTSMEARAAAIASYQGGSSLVQSDVYLNGGTGSDVSETEAVRMDYYSYSTGESRGICRLISVMEDTPTTNFVSVYAKDEANGTEMLLPVIKGGSSAEKDYCLTEDGTFIQPNFTPTFVLSKAKGRTALATFMTNNGITMQ